MKYRCLVLDHDDTVVRSAETVNYPALLENLKVRHPDRYISFEDFVRYCFRYNFTGMCRNCLSLTDEEIAEQFEFWKVYVRTHIPPAFDGFGPLLQRFRAKGGIICVSSHSSVENIARDYERNFGLQPDAVYAWELGETLRKPHPYTLCDIIRRFELQPHEILMVDDMKNGFDMAKSCCVPFAFAGWSMVLPEIGKFMHENSDHYLDSVSELEKLLFGT